MFYPPHKFSCVVKKNPLSFIRLIKASLSIFLLSYVQAYSIAAEIDSVTSRHVKLPDVINDINLIINDRIHQAVEMANADRLLIEEIEGIEIKTQRAECDVGYLYTSLRQSIFQSYMVEWGLKGYDLDLQFRELLVGKAYSLRLDDSIYRDIDYLEGFSLNLKELSDVASINGHVVGLDKLGHFFAEGWRYFEISHEEDGSLPEAMDWGRGKEEGLFGTTTTGIFSYADLVANFNGWRFWNRVLLEEGDPLKGPIERFFDRSYVSCDIQMIESIKQLKLVRAWAINREFDLRDYIDAAWDEGINCNGYADPFIEEKVKGRMTEIDAHYHCPVDTAACVKAQWRYGVYAPALLHPQCLIEEP